MNLQIHSSREDETQSRLRGRKIQIVNLRDAEARFDKTGTADVLLGASFGVSIKDEGDFIHVRFGPNDLTPLGSAPSGARAFRTKKEAFEFAAHLQVHITRHRVSPGSPTLRSGGVKE